MNGQLEVPFDKDRRRQSYELSQEHLMVNKVIVVNCFLSMTGFFLTSVAEKTKTQAQNSPKT